LGGLFFQLGRNPGDARLTRALKRQLRDSTRYASVLKGTRQAGPPRHGAPVAGLLFRPVATTVTSGRMSRRTQGEQGTAAVPSSA
jgi:hypothetical protein